MQKHPWPGHARVYMVISVSVMSAPTFVCLKVLDVWQTCVNTDTHHISATHKHAVALTCRNQ